MKLAAIDVGLKRIGVAIAPDGKTVLPQAAIVRKGRNQAAAEVKRFLQQWEIETLIVGIPKGGSSEEEMRRRIEHFVGLMALEIPVVYVNEADSSEEAKAMMQGIVRQKRDGRIDSIAAKLILERYLSSAHTP